MHASHICLRICIRSSELYLNVVPVHSNSTHTRQMKNKRKKDCDCWYPYAQTRRKRRRRSKCWTRCSRCTARTRRQRHPSPSPVPSSGSRLLLWCAISGMSGLSFRSPRPLATMSIVQYSSLGVLRVLSSVEAGSTAALTSTYSYSNTSVLSFEGPGRGGGARRGVQATQRAPEDRARCPPLHTQKLRTGKRKTRWCA